MSEALCIWPGGSQKCGVVPGEESEVGRDFCGQRVPVLPVFDLAPHARVICHRIVYLITLLPQIIPYAGS